MSERNLSEEQKRAVARGAKPKRMRGGKTDVTRAKTSYGEKSTESEEMR